MLKTINLAIRACENIKQVSNTPHIIMAMDIAISALKEQIWHQMPGDPPTGEKRLLEIVPKQPDAYDRYIGWWDDQMESFIGLDGFSFNGVAWREKSQFDAEAWNDCWRKNEQQTQADSKGQET